MKEPEFDKGGYPTENTLSAIKGWDHNDLEGWFRFCKECWRYAVRESGNVIEFPTGGWSGNESVISAMEANLVLWSLSWLRSERGGLYVFRTTLDFWPDEEVKDELTLDDFRKIYGLLNQYKYLSTITEDTYDFVNSEIVNDLENKLKAIMGEYDNK